MPGPQFGGSRNCRIADDDAIDLFVENHLGDSRHVIVVEIRCDFYQDRRTGPGTARPDVDEPIEQAGQCIFLLQITKSRGIGRRNIDCDVVDQSAHGAKSNRVIFHRIGAPAVRTQIRANHTAGAGSGT